MGWGNLPPHPLGRPDGPGGCGGGGGGQMAALTAHLFPAERRLVLSSFRDSQLLPGGGPGRGRGSSHKNPFVGYGGRRRTETWFIRLTHAKLLALGRGLVQCSALRAWIVPTYRCSGDFALFPSPVSGYYWHPVFLLRPFYGVFPLFRRALVQCAHRVGANCFPYSRLTPF